MFFVLMCCDGCMSLLFMSICFVFIVVLVL